MSAADLSRCARRIEVVCETVEDGRALRVQVVAELQSVLGMRAFAFVLTDPRTAVGVAPVAQLPWIGDLPQHIALRYLTPVNRWTTLGPEPVAMLHQATGGELARSLMWRELLCHHGVSDAASVVFADRFGCWAFLELWKAGGASRFTAPEAAFLSDLVAPLATALRRCQARSLALRGPAVAVRAAPVVLLLTSELEVLGQTAATAEYLRVLVPPAEGRAPIPAVAYNVAAQLLAVEAGVDSAPATARVHVAGSLWMTARAARLDAAGGEDARHIAVTLEPISGADRIDLLVRAFGLTPREGELLGQLSGRSTRELAAGMVLSQHTVQDHLKAIFEKTGTQSRRALLALAHGY